MNIFYSLNEYTSNKNAFVTIGTFDGVHIGHQKIILDLILNANKQKAAPVVLTFFPHPRMVLQKNSEIKLINTLEERIDLLQKTGLESLIIQEFTPEFAKKSSAEFVKTVLFKILNIKKLFIGYDHQFGNNREGNFELLQKYGKEFGFEVIEIPQQDINEVAVSSTKIRKAIETGNILRANSYLGYNFMLAGTVEKGANVGSKIGFPTANLNISEPYKILPKTGAYLVKSLIEDSWVFGMMNIGFRPTLNGKHQTIEIHFFDFYKNLYEKKIKVEVLDFLRDEQKFDSIETLKFQLHKDKAHALSLIEGFLN